MRRSSLSALTASMMLFGSSAVFGAAFSLNSIAVDGSQYAPIIGASGESVPGGSGIAAVGMFASDPAGRVPDAALLQEFTAYASGAFGIDIGAGDLLPGVVGYERGDIIDDAFNDMQIYIVFGDGADLLSSNGLAIVDAGATFMDDDPNSPTPMAFDVDLNEALTNGSIVWGNATDQAIPEIDALGVPIGNAGGVQLVAVPEPGTAALGMLGLLLVAVRRRR